MKPVVKTEIQIDGGRKTHYTFGLNIFAANNVNVEIDDDPRIVFLKTLTERYTCSAHIGLEDIVTDSVSLFGPAGRHNDYSLVDVTLHAGHFYAPNNDSKGCFFPTVTPQFWGSLFEHPLEAAMLLSSDAIAFYAINDNETLDSQKQNTVEDLLSNFISGDSDWLDNMTKLYSLVVQTAADGWMFESQSQNSLHFDMLSFPDSQAVLSIERSHWFRKYFEEMQWDDENEGCLMLPSLLQNAVHKNERT